ncbi:serine hydrolase domain-containing protein [Aliikangiella sp. IMCC44632]
MIRTGVKETLKETLDTALNENISANEAGLSMLVVQRNEVLYENSVGMANIHSGIPISVNTGFRIASISKMFTGVAIMQLRSAGYLSIDDPISKYLPEAPVEWHDITIHHLLSHQSGIPDFANDIDTYELIRGAISNASIIEYFKTNPSLEFDPGTQSDYSNTGYVLLAVIIEQLSEMSLADYLNLNVFQPSGMSNSIIFDELAEYRVTDALSYASEDDIFGEEFYATGTAGQVSSVLDLKNFIDALKSHQLVSSESLSLMLKRHSKFELSISGYGYGIQYFHPTESIFGHSGANGGFLSLLIVDEAKDSYIIILGNGGEGLPDLMYLVELAGEFIN